MTEIVEPKLQFALTPRRPLWRRLWTMRARRIPSRSRFAKLVTAYTGNFRKHVERIGYIAADILHVKGRWPLEAVAMRLTTQGLRDSVARPESPDSTN
jgi:hypothetical protein